VSPREGPLRARWNWRGTLSNWDTNATGLRNITPFRGCLLSHTRADRTYRCRDEDNSGGQRWGHAAESCTLVVAEQFGTLEAIYPGRIDLGLGRAPEANFQTMRALRRGLAQDGDDFRLSLNSWHILRAGKTGSARQSNTRTKQQCAIHVARIERLQCSTGSGIRLTLCVRSTFCT